LCTCADFTCCLPERGHRSWSPTQCVWSALSARGAWMLPPIDALLQLTPLVVRVRVALLAPLSLSTWRAVACCRPGSAPVVSVSGPSAATGWSRLIVHATSTLLASVLAWFLCAFLQPCRPNPAAEVTRELTRPFPSLLCRHEHWTCTLYSAGRGHLGLALRARCFAGLCLYQLSPPRLASCAIELQFGVARHRAI
jgi:hypothetical protein